MNDVVLKLEARPLIEINSSRLMMGKWLFDTGAGLACMFTQQFRLIPKHKRPSKLTLNQKEIRGASVIALIPHGDYLFPIKQ
jgi:hypothetical protein